MAGQSKILTTFVERRQIEDQLHQMAATQSEAEFAHLAQQVAAQGALALSAILAHLGRADSRRLAALGVVVSLLEREPVIQALYQVIHTPGRTDRERLAAMTLLERFLGEKLDETLLTSLRDPDALAQASLREMLDHLDDGPLVLIEFMRGMDDQVPDVARRVVAALGEMEDPRAIEPLRCLAQDVRPDIAAEAIAALGRRPVPEAAAALQTVRPLLSGDLDQQAERALRKLYFRRVPPPSLPEPDPAWRALVSPVDGLGRQSVWFIQPCPSPPDRDAEAEGATARFLSVALLDTVGLNSALANPALPVGEVPAALPVGAVHQINFSGAAGRLFLLEAPFDYGRTLLLRAAETNRAQGYVFPPELRLFGGWLWGSTSEGLPWPPPRPDAPEGNAGLMRQTGRLLEHPAFEGWFVQSDALYEAAEQILRGRQWDLPHLLQRLARQHLTDAEQQALYGQRLTRIAEWLVLAGDLATARLAAAAAQTLSRMPSGEHPFALALVRRGLQVAALNLQLGSG